MTMDMTDGDAGDEAVQERDESLTDSFERLATSARALADAEIGLVKARGAILTRAGRSVAILGVVALVTAFGMIVTLMIGAVLALAPLIGLPLALLTVVVAALIAILLCGLAIKAQVTRAKEAFR